MTENRSTCQSVMPADVEAMFAAASKLGFDALCIYDRQMHSIEKMEINSLSLRCILSEQSLLHIIDVNNGFTTIDIRNAQPWQLVQSPYNAILSMNVCIDRQRNLFVNFQAIPIQIGCGGMLRYLLCSINLSVRTQKNIILRDKITQKLWRYSEVEKAFYKVQRVELREHEIEVLRLCKLGYDAGKIAQILHKSLDTIKGYKRSIFEKLQVVDTASAIAYASLHHLI